MTREITIALSVTVVLAAAAVQPGFGLRVREPAASREALTTPDTTSPGLAASAASAIPQEAPPPFTSDRGPDSILGRFSRVPSFLFYLLGIVAVFVVWEIVRHFREKSRDSDVPLVIGVPDGNPRGTRTVWPSDMARSTPPIGSDPAWPDSELESARPLGPWTRQRNMPESEPHPSPEPHRQPNVESAPSSQPGTSWPPAPARAPTPPPSPLVVRPAAAFEPAPPPSAAVVPPGPPVASVPPAAAAVPGRPAPRETARALNREGTRVLMPGRLEFVSNDPRKEIRFVQVEGTDVVTFGRYEGETYTHVRLDSPTVSRLHASMRFAGGHWFIRNLSATNPVVLNGERLSVEEGEQQLHDGDRVEMGEIIFRFRSR